MSTNETPYRLLIVDSSITARKMVCRKIKELLPASIAVEAENGSVAKEKLEEEEFDIVISELNITRISGLKLLEWMRGQSKLKMVPFVIHTVECDRDIIKKSIQLGATDYILKPVTGEVLARKITENIEKIQKVIKDKKDIVSSITLPAQPQVLQDIETEFAKEEPDLKAIVDMVSKDLSLSARLLKIVSSPFYGVGKVSSIDRALGVLGLKEFRQLVIATIMQKELGAQGAISESFQHHSMIGAKVATFLVEEKLPPLATNPGKQKELVSHIYLAGLFQNCGMPIMAGKFTDYDMDKMIDADDSIVEDEQDRFFSDHCSLGFMMVRSWGLPESVCQAVKFHHAKDMEMPQDTADRSGRKIWAVLQLTNYLYRLYMGKTEPCSLLCDVNWLDAHESAASELAIDFAAIKTIKASTAALLESLESKP